MNSHLDTFCEYERTVLSILKLHKHQRDHFSSIDAPVLPFVYARFGRGFGATTFIKKHAQSDDIVIVANDSLKKLMTKDAWKGPKVFTEHDIIFHGRHQGLRPTRVWIDSPTQINEHLLFQDFPFVEQIIFL